MAYRDSDVPPEVDRSVLVVGLHGFCRGLDRATGELIWETAVGDGVTSVEMRYGVLAVSSMSSLVCRLDYYTGETLWRASTQGWGRATMVIESDCIIVSKDDYIDAFSHDGSLLWKQHLKGKGGGGASIGFPGNVAQADRDT